MGLELTFRGDRVTAPSLSSFKSRLEQFDFFLKWLLLNNTNSCASKYRVIWLIVSGRGYDALMPWYNVSGRGYDAHMPLYNVSGRGYYALMPWYNVSGRGYDALMPWYNQATLRCYFVLIACIYVVISLWALIFHNCKFYGVCHINI